MYDNNDKQGTIDEEIQVFKAQDRPSFVNVLGSLVFRNGRHRNDEHLMFIMAPQPFSDNYLMTLTYSSRVLAQHWGYIYSSIAEEYKNPLPSTRMEEEHHQTKIDFDPACFELRWGGTVGGALDVRFSEATNRRFMCLCGGKGLNLQLRWIEAKLKRCSQ
ncbi:hypothetical protein A2U01_0011496, partial [Trifolium medium]|nr:hypothetical protein [Trifolium medium]